MDALSLTQTELGDALKKKSPYATVHGWIKGRKKLEYEDTFDIAELCGWLNYPYGDVDEQAFGRSLLGQIVRLLDQEPGLSRRRPDLLRVGAAELRGLADRMEDAAGRQSDVMPPS